MTKAALKELDCRNAKAFPPSSRGSSKQFRRPTTRGTVAKWKSEHRLCEILTQDAFAIDRNIESLLAVSPSIEIPGLISQGENMRFLDAQEHARRVEVEPGAERSCL